MTDVKRVNIFHRVIRSFFMVCAFPLTKAFQSGKYVSNLTRIHLVIVIMVKIASKKLLCGDPTHYELVSKSNIP